MLTMRIVPGASALPLMYERLVDEVSAHGYDIQALHIPSVGLVTGPRPGEPPTMLDDAAFIASHVADLVEAGKDVLLITHSYGGTPGTQAVKGLAKTERLEQGKPGGIVGLAYMASLVPEVGMSAAPQAKLENGPLMAVGDDGWSYYPDMAAVASTIFSNIPREEGEYWAKKLVNHSAVSFSTPLTYAGYNDIPASYFIAERDLSITPEYQRSRVEMIERVSNFSVDVTISDADHAPFISALDDVVNWILRVATKLETVVAMVMYLTMDGLVEGRVCSTGSQSSYSSALHPLLWPCSGMAAFKT